MNNLDIACVVYDDWLSGADAMLLQIVVATHGAWDLSEESEDRWFPVFSAYRDELLCSLRSVPKRWTRNDCASLHWMVLNDIRFHWFEVARILPPILDTHFYRQRLLMPWLGTQPAEMKLRFSRDNEFRYLPPIAAVTSLEIIVDVDNGRGSWPTTPWPNVRDLFILGDRHLHSNEFSLTLQTFPNLKSLCIYETRVNIVDIDDNAPIASIRMFYGSGMMLLPDVPLPQLTEIIIYNKYASHDLFRFACRKQAPYLHRLMVVNQIRPATCGTFSRLRSFHCSLDQRHIWDWLDKCPAVEEVYLYDFIQIESIPEDRWPSTMTKLVFVNWYKMGMTSVSAIRPRCAVHYVVTTTGEEYVFDKGWKTSTTKSNVISFAV